MRWHDFFSTIFTCGLALAISGCTSAEQRYRVRRSDLSCQEANRYAYQAMSHLNYEITEFRPAKPEAPGLIRAKRQQGKRAELKGTIDIVCKPKEVSLSPKEHSGLFPDLTFARGFYLAFTALADAARGNSLRPRNRKDPGQLSGRGGLTLKITPVPGLEAKLDFGEDLQAAGILPVRILLVNRSRRKYYFDTGDVRLRVQGHHQGVGAMTIERAGKLLAAAARNQEESGGPPAKPTSFYTSLLSKRLLGSKTLGSGEKVEGFLFFPLATYTRARVVVTDVATSETEGFMIEF